MSRSCKKGVPDGLHDTDEEVGLGIDLEVDEVILLGVTRREAQKVELFLLHDQAQRAQAVRDYGRLVINHLWKRRKLITYRHR